MVAHPTSRTAGLALALSLTFVHPIAAQYGTSNGEWRYYGGDAGHTRYAPLDQINKDNVKNLQVVWRWKTENFGARPDYNFESTPLMVGGVLYTTAGSSRSVAAIDAATGETLWMYRLDEGTRAARAPIRPAAGRGVGYWSDGNEARILHVTRGYQLVALDAKSGLPVRSFGKEGVVDLFQELDAPETPKEGVIGWNSPPIVVKDTVVIGAAFGGNNAASTGTYTYPSVSSADSGAQAPTLPAYSAEPFSQVSLPNVPL